MQCPLNPKCGAIANASSRICHLLCLVDKHGKRPIQPVKSRFGEYQHRDEESKLPKTGIVTLQDQPASIAKPREGQTKEVLHDRGEDAKAHDAKRNNQQVQVGRHSMHHFEHVVSVTATCDQHRQGVHKREEEALAHSVKEGWLPKKDRSKPHKRIVRLLRQVTEDGHANP
jgi:hypothetical protein